MKLRNLRPFAVVISPQDHPDIDVDEGEAFDVEPADLARRLLEQTDNYGPVDDDAHALAAEIAAELAGHQEAAVAAEASEDMKASELIGLLDSLSPDELVDLRDREAAGKSRSTVLARIDELLAAPTGGGEES